MLQSSFVAFLHLKSMAFCSYPSSVITKTLILYPHFSYETQQICFTLLQFAWVLISCLIMITRGWSSFKPNIYFFKITFLYWVMIFSSALYLANYHPTICSSSSHKSSMFLTNHCILFTGVR